ncbi:MAG: DUF2179 domain-containing protein [Phycisphaerales bacterium JB038]
MEYEVILTCLFIFTARIVDVSMGTLRTLWMVQGRKLAVFVLGFVEILIWVLAVSKVIQNLGEEPVYALVYAFGFASGNYIGLLIDQKLAYGEQVLRIFCREGKGVAQQLREQGFGVTVFKGEGRDSDVDMLFVETKRKRSPQVIGTARKLDPMCYYVVDTVQVASTARATGPEPTGWRAKLKKK